MLCQISSRELTEWMAYYQLEPFGEERADLRMAILAALIANSNRDPKQRKQPFTMADFLPRFDAEPTEPLEPAQPVAVAGDVLDQVLAWGAATGATVVVKESVPNG